MFIPDYLGDDQWSLNHINQNHYKLKSIFKYEDLSYEEVVKKYYIPWVEFDLLTYGWQTWLDEAKKLDELDFFSIHKENYGKGWRTFNFYELEESVTNICPAMTQWVKRVFPEQVSLKGQINKIELIALDPQGYVELHRDNENNKVHNLHLALNNPKGYKFIMFYPNSFDKTKLTDEDYIGKVPFAEGKALQLDLGNYYAVQNNSDEVRYHLNIDADFWPDEKTKKFYDISIRNTIGNIKKYA
jgi:hypothetical protein